MMEEWRGVVPRQLTRRMDRVRFLERRKSPGRGPVAAVTATVEAAAAKVMLARKGRGVGKGLWMWRWSRLSSKG